MINKMMIYNLPNPLTILIASHKPHFAIKKPNFQYP